MRQLLRLSHAHVQWTMYRPFLHFASSSFQAESIDQRSYLCAAACVSTARKIIQTVRDMHHQGLLNGSYWFPTHVTYFAVLTLIYFILENSEGPRVKLNDLEAALEGKAVLEALAKSSLAIERCSCLRVSTCVMRYSQVNVDACQSLFKNLPEKFQSYSSISGIIDPRVSRGQIPEQLSRELPEAEAGLSASSTLLSNDQNVSVFDNLWSEPVQWQEASLPRHHDNQHSNPDMMAIFSQPEINFAPVDGINSTRFAPEDMEIFDDMCTRFGLDMYYKNYQGQK